MLVIGIDIGGMSIKAGLVNAVSGKIIAKNSVKTKVSDGANVIVSDVCALIEKTINDAKIKIEDISGIGIGIPGSIDSKRGYIVYSNNIKLENVPIIKKIKKYYNVPIHINNDANAAALGEVKFGAAKGLTDIVLVTLGTGVGTGIVVNGKLLEGKASAGAEGGHMVIRHNGKKCSCGRKGCFEMYASAKALIENTELQIKKNKNSTLAKIAEANGGVDGRTAFQAAKEGDLVAKLIISIYIKDVAEGLVNLANIFRPDAILIGGGISNEEDKYLLEPLQEYMDDNCYGVRNGNETVPIYKAKLTNDAGILGAASLVVDRD